MGTVARGDLTKENLRNFWLANDVNMTDVLRASQRSADQENKSEWIVHEATGKVTEVTPDPVRSTAYNRGLGERVFDPDMVEQAWILLANAHQGDWSQATPEWRQAVERWRDEQYFPWLRGHTGTPEEPL